MTRRITFLSLLTATLLVASVAATVGIAAAFDPGGVGQGGPSREQQERNWEYANYNKWAWNYNPQTDINPTNVGGAEVRWIFPIPSAESQVADTQPGVGLAGGQGSITPPLIVDGTVYILTNWKRVYAMDAGNGDIKWTWTHEIDYQTVVDTCDPACFPPGAGSHVHALNYIDGNLWFAGYACSVFAIDAKSGDVSYQIDDICKDVPGNDGGFYANNGVFPPSIHRGSNTLVHSWSAQDANWGGRGFMYGIDLDKVPKGVPYSANFDADGWRFFTTPPRDGDPDFTLRHCDKGYFFVAKEYIARRNSDGTTENPQHRVEGTNTGGQVHCSDVPEANLKNDWHIPKDEWIQSSSRKTPIHITTSTTAMWGQFPLDEETGMVYGCTGNASPWHNHTIGGYGPWWPATALLGVQAETGELVWWHQTVPRDNWDWDCNWSTKLALVDIEGYGQQKVVLRHSKIGYMWALDAATGEAFWGTRHTNLKYYDHQCQSGDYPQCVDVDASASCRCYYMLDPREQLDMEQQWGLPGPDGYDEPIQFLQIPSIGGAAESEFSYNPDTQTIYIISQNVVWDVGITPTLDEPHGISSSFVIPPEIQKNTSLLAIDASNGEELWSFYIPDTGHRGGVFESGGVVYLPSGDGNLYMVDAANGQLLAKKAFGQPLYSQSTIGKASNGDSIIFQLYGGTFWAGFGLGIDAEHVPGALVAYHVPDDAVQAQVVIQEVEVEKIVEKEVEVITEVPVEVEVINPLSYVVIALGVILVVVAGVLFSRSRTSTT